MQFIGGEIAFQNYNSGTQVIARSGTALFRDSASWYNIVIAMDSTQSTPADRLKLYVNGTQVTSFDGSDADLTLNYEGQFNDTRQHTIGCRQAASQSAFFDGYLAEVNFIDGSALTPSSFGETKENIWIPKDTSGLTFGTNGFRLQFKNSSVGSASSSTVGADTSGNNNHFSSNNVTTTDNMNDSPTDNFCVMNPQAPFGTPSAFTLADGNLDLTFTSSSGNDSAVATMGVSSGKFYYEVELVSQADDANGGFTTAELLASETGTDGASNSKSIGFQRGNRAIIFGSEPSPTQRFTTLSDGDVLGFALDLDSSPRTLKMFINGAGSATVDVEVPSNQGDTFIPCCGDDGLSAGQYKFNFGANGFTHTPPSGHVALSTANLPNPAIDPARGENPTDYFNSQLYTGNASSRSLDMGHATNWVWLKMRDGTDSHVLADSVRGADEFLSSNNTNAKNTANGCVTAFNSNGFSLGSQGIVNDNGKLFVAWSWKAGGSAVTNNNGSITSSVSANTEAGISIVGYQGTMADANIGHGLSSPPDWIIIKNRNRSAGTNWVVFHSAIGASQRVLLNSDASASSSGNIFGSTPTAPDSTKFYVGNVNWVNNNVSGENDHVAFCFHSVDGFSKFGKYDDRVVGSDYDNTSPFVYTGFRPAFLMIKGTSTGREWVIYDNKRTPDNGVYLRANTEATEQTDATNHDISFLSNGFKIRGGSGDINTTGESYIYMAFADQPFKFANGGTE
jgi:hypothetical protein